jgi:hypothetical protein
MYIRKERLESLIGWTCDYSYDNSQILANFQNNHMNIDASQWTDWLTIRDSLPQLPTMEIIDGHIIRTTYWDNITQYEEALDIVNSIYENSAKTYNCVLIEEQVV